MEDWAHRLGFCFELLFVEVIHELFGQLIESSEVLVLQFFVEFSLELGEFLFELVLEKHSEVLGLIFKLLLESLNSSFVLLVES